MLSMSWVLIQTVERRHPLGKSCLYRDVGRHYRTNIKCGVIPDFTTHQDELVLTF